MIEEADLIISSTLLMVVVGLWHGLQEFKGNSSFEVMWGGQQFLIGFIEVSPKLPEDYGSWTLALILWVDPSPKKLDWGALVSPII